MLCSYYKKTVNICIYIPSTDLHYRLVEFYSFSTINSFLNRENGSVFFNTLINNVHGYTLTISITHKYAINQTNTHNNNNIIISIVVHIYADSKMPPGAYLFLRNTHTGHGRTPYGACPHKNILLHFVNFFLFLVETILL